MFLRTKLAAASIAKFLFSYLHKNMIHQFTKYSSGKKKIFRELVKSRDRDCFGNFKKALFSNKRDLAVEV